MHGPGGYHPNAPHAAFRRDIEFDVNLIIKMMDDRDVDLSVLTQTNPHVLWAPPAFGLKLAQAINDATSALYVKYPEALHRRDHPADAGRERSRCRSSSAPASCRACGR